MAFPKLALTSLSDDCYRVLKEKILALELAPGTPLVEYQIATQLGISKTPVREACARLAGEGLVVIDRGRGVYVAGLTLRKARELYHLRMILESASIREVTARLTSDDLATLDRYTTAAAAALECDDLASFIANNEAFHHYLIARGTNQTLIGIVSSLFEQVRRVRVSLYRTDRDDTHNEVSHRGIEHHRRIIAALGTGDPECAATAMRADIQLFLDLIDTPVVRDALDQLTYHQTARAGITKGDDDGAGEPTGGAVTAGRASSDSGVTT